jgi:YgiT-type zinc finger domain-containing protein
MKCVICKLGQTHTSHATFTLASDASVMVFKNAPAMVCEDCDESYFTSEVTNRVLLSAEKTMREHREYAAEEYV